jgi:DUF2924 family protein
MDRGENAVRRRGVLVDRAIAMEIEGLRKLKTKALKARYQELFGEESRSSNQAHLFRRIAWRLQARAEGDLSERARKRMLELANDELRLRAPRSFWHSVGLGADPTRDLRLPPAGTVLKRVYGARTIEVTVLERGFDYQGKQYGSLSLIAQHVTGTRWNGYLFFGLQKEHGR